MYICINCLKFSEYAFCDNEECGFTMKELKKWDCCDKINSIDDDGMSMGYFEYRGKIVFAEDIINTIDSYCDDYYYDEIGSKDYTEKKFLQFYKDNENLIISCIDDAMDVREYREQQKANN